MSIVTATVDTTRALSRVDVDFSDVNAPYVKVYRVNAATGAQSAVRPYGYTSGGWPLSPGGTLTLYDVEVPLDTPIYYLANYDSASAVVPLNDNPYFEGGMLPPWQPQNGASILASTVQVHDGAYALRVTPDGVTNNPGAVSEVLPATPGVVYTVSGWLWATFSATRNLRIVWYDAGNVQISAVDVVSLALAGTTWAFGSGTATAPANAATMRLVFFAPGLPGATSLFYGDSLVVGQVVTNRQATSALVTVPSNGFGWLRDPARPAASVRLDMSRALGQMARGQGISLVDSGDKTRKSNAVALNINNSPYPVVTSRSRQAPTYTIRLVSRSPLDRDTLNALLAPGGVLLLQLPAVYNEPDRYVSVGDSAEGRIIQDYRKLPRVHSLPVAETSSPAGTAQGGPGARWMDISSVRFGTWSQVIASGMTWRQMRQGAAD